MAEQYKLRNDPVYDTLDRLRASSRGLEMSGSALPTAGKLASVSSGGGGGGGGGGGTGDPLAGVGSFRVPPPPPSPLQQQMADLTASWLKAQAAAAATLHLQATQTADSIEQNGESFVSIIA